MISKHDSSVIQTQYAIKCSEVFQAFKNMFSVTNNQFLFVSLVSKSVCRDHNSFIKHLRQLPNNQRQKIIKQGYVIIGNSALILNSKKNKFHGEARLLDPTGKLRSKIGLSNQKQNPEDLHVFSRLKDAFHKACPMNEEYTCTIEIFSHYVPCTLAEHNCSGLISKFYQENKFRIKVVYEEVFYKTDENTALERLKHIDIQRIPSNTHTPHRRHIYGQANLASCTTSPRKERIVGESTLNHLNTPASAVHVQTTASNPDVGILKASKEADRESLRMSMNMRPFLTTVPPVQVDVGETNVDNPEKVQLMSTNCQVGSRHMIGINSDKVEHSLSCSSSTVSHSFPDIPCHDTCGSALSLIHGNGRNCISTQGLERVNRWSLGILPQTKPPTRPPKRSRKPRRSQRKRNKKINKRMQIELKYAKGCWPFQHKAGLALLPDQNTGIQLDH